MRNLLIRAASGIVYVALILVSTFYLSWGGLLLATLLGSFAIIEWQLFKPSYVSVRSASFGIAILVLSLYLFGNFPGQGISETRLYLTLLLGLSLMLINLCLLAFDRKDEGLSQLFHHIVGLVYLIPPLLSLALLAEEPWLLAGIFIIIWSFDSFAYLVGRFLGKHKLMPKISPKKTWEGFIGGLFFALLSAYLLDQFGAVDIISTWQWLLLGFIVVISSTFGDLFESALKRSHGLKDSGNFMPGHGGILDRIDSLLFAMPLAYLFIELTQHL